MLEKKWRTTKQGDTLKAYKLILIGLLSPIMLGACSSDSTPEHPPQSLPNELNCAAEMGPAANNTTETLPPSQIEMADKARQGGTSGLDIWLASARVGMRAEGVDGECGLPCWMLAGSCLMALSTQHWKMLYYDGT